MKKIRDRQAKWYNRNAGKEEIEFLPGSRVLLQDKFTKKWSKGIIVEKTKFPRSYIVKDDKGKLMR